MSHRHSSHGIYGGAARQYARTERLNRLVREIVADELERIDDSRLELVTVTVVSVESDLRRAVVFYDSLSGEGGDAEVLAALRECRVRLQAAIGRQTRIKRTPELTFRPDEVERSAARIEEILRELHDEDDGPAADA